MRIQRQEKQNNARKIPKWGSRFIGGKPYRLSDLRSCNQEIGSGITTATLPQVALIALSSLGGRLLGRKWMEFVLGERSPLAREPLRVGGGNTR
jgi:hypothetical protein